MGRWPCISVSHRNGLLSGTGKGRIGAVNCCAGTAGALDFGGSSKQYLVSGRLGQPPGGQSVSAAILYQLQLEERLVPYLAADANGELGSSEWQPMDRAVRRRNWTNHEAGIPTVVAHRAILWHPCAPSRNSILEHAITDCVPVPQADRRAKKDATGKKLKQMDQPPPPPSN